MNSTGIIMAVLSAVFMGTIGVFSRITGLPAETITFFRLAIGAGFLALFLLCTGRGNLLRQVPSWPVAVNGALLAGFIIFYVQAMNLTSMANAIMLVYLAPVVASIYAHFHLGERVNLVGWGLIGMALAGFAVMMELRLDLREVAGNHAAGLAFALLAMFCYAGFILINRQIRNDVPALNRAFYQLLIGSVVMAPFFWIAEATISPANALWLLATGLVPGFLAITLAVIALSRLPAATFGTLAYIEPVTVVLFGWTLFDEKLSSMQILGCMMIMSSGCCKAWMQSRSRRQS